MNTPQSRERARRRRYGLRLALIITITYLGATAVLYPKLNPLMWLMPQHRSDSVAIVASALSEIAYAQSVLADVMPVGFDEDVLPQFGLDQDRSRFTLLTVLPPNQLAVRLRRVGFLDEDILAAEIVLKLDTNLPQGQRTWSCRVEGEWPNELLPPACQRGTALDPVTILGWALVICVLIIVGLVGLLWFANPLLRPIQRSPARLLRQPLFALPKLNRVMSLLGRTRTLLSAANVEQRDWTEAVGYLNREPSQQAELLGQRLKASVSPAQEWDLRGPVFTFRFIHDLPISLQQVLVYFPDPTITPSNLARYLDAIKTGLDVMLIVTRRDDGVSTTVVNFCRHSAQLLVCLDETAQTEILLQSDPQQAFVRCLANQLSVTRISPYQTRGGITRPSAFFGRQQMLTRIINREPANYLVVGGRQLGKTSLLKAVQRQLAHQPNIECQYISLRDHRLAPRLATLFGLPEDSSLDQVLTSLRERYTHTRLLLLIDEADPFMAFEADHHCTQLSALRSASDEGQIHVVLAGFWALYAATILDYQSPVRNFGEVITIGALEPDACVRLATEPLQVLGVQWQDEALVHQLVTATGGRANLIAIICQECLEHLPSGERVIGPAQLEAALASQAVADSLSGWTRLSNDELGCRIDRALVYFLANHDEVALHELLDKFSQHFEAQQIQASLQRLRLAFVLKENRRVLSFAVPLFRRQLDAGEAAVFLHSELSAQ